MAVLIRQECINNGVCPRSPCDSENQLVTKNGSVSKWSDHKSGVLERWSDNLRFSILNHAIVLRSDSPSLRMRKKAATKTRSFFLRMSGFAPKACGTSQPDRMREDSFTLFNLLALRRSAGCRDSLRASSSLSQLLHVHTSGVKYCPRHTPRNNTCTRWSVVTLQTIQQGVVYRRGTRLTR